MMNKFLIASLLLTTCMNNSAVAKSNKKNEVADTDYGILSSVDRVRDGSRPLKWRCFPIKDVKVKYRTWPDTDPLNPKKIIEIMCDFEIFAEDKSAPHHYGGRRGKPESYCNDFKAAWKKLTRGEKHICLEGETLTNGTPEMNETSKKLEVSWTWDKIKTKKGCYGFWDGYDCKYN